MRVFSLPLFLLLSIALLGCASPEILITPTSPHVNSTDFPAQISTHEPTETLTVQPISSVTPLPTEPAAPTPDTQPPEYVLRYQPLDIATELPANANLTGKLVITNAPDYLLNIDKGTKQELPENILCLSSSPDGKWLAYCQYEEHLLIIQNDNGEQVITLPMGKDWWIFITSDWLDNQHLVFNLKWSDDTEIKSIRPVVVVNPFTGEIQELASDYPGLKPRITGPGGGTLHFVRSTVVYHPSLDLVIYPKTTLDNFSIILYDRQSGETLASVRDLAEYGRIPIWSPTSDEFAVVVIHQDGKIDTDEFRSYIEEWFGVTRTGDVQQLTYFGDFFDHVAISNANWSPDGKRLAFWLRTIPSDCGEGEYLAVLERETLQVTNYCVPGSILVTHSPIWSPDGQYIAVENYDGDIRRIIMVSIQNAWAAQIDEGVAPVGWLVSP